MLIIFSQVQCYNSHTTPPDLVECKPDEEACVALQQDTDSKKVTLECRHQDPAIPDCEVIELPTQHADVKKLWHYCYCKSDGCNNMSVCYCGGKPPGEYRTTGVNSSATEGIHSKSKSALGMIIGPILITIIHKLFKDLSQPVGYQKSNPKFMQN